jgi:hypothetical protein
MITYFVLWCYLLIQGMAHNTGVLPLAKGGALQNIMALAMHPSSNLVLLGAVDQGIY